MLSKYGRTALEVERSIQAPIFKYINQSSGDSMDYVLANTIHGLSDYVKELRPDMIIVHGDRVEAMAGAIVGALNNVLVGHIEGGEVSGTADELMRHSISKMAHLHFVCNEHARKRLLQLGELDSSIFIVGSPDLDVMTSTALPTIDEAKRKYELPFDEYAMFMYHPVTTEIHDLAERVDQVVEALLESTFNYVVIYPNNDHGTDLILDRFKSFLGNDRFRIFPSIRFEYFVTLLKHARLMIGNSSAGVREAPYFGVPSINIGSRQNNRARSPTIVNVPEQKENILNALEATAAEHYEPVREFGSGNSADLFVEVIRRSEVWQIAKQKQFRDIPFT
jgi:UDP-N-acetylglucosamine 2-epimerase (hydrolysing)